jgi:hypothetical protein
MKAAILAGTLALALPLVAGARLSQQRRPSHRRRRRASSRRRRHRRRRGRVRHPRRVRPARGNPGSRSTAAGRAPHRRSQLAHPRRTRPRAAHAVPPAASSTSSPSIRQRRRAPGLSHVVVDGRWMTAEEGYRARGYALRRQVITPRERAGLIAERRGSPGAAGGPRPGSARRGPGPRGRGGRRRGRKRRRPPRAFRSDGGSPYGTYGPVVVYGASGGFRSGRRGRFDHGHDGHDGRQGPGHGSGRPSTGPAPAPPTPRRDVVTSPTPTSARSSGVRGANAGVNPKN